MDNTIHRLVILDGDTFGAVPYRGLFERIGQLKVFPHTADGNVTTRLSEADVAITNKVPISAESMAQCPKLRLICVAATGTNNIDLKAAHDRGIAVCNVPGYSTDSVVSHTFALYFALAHQIRYHDAFVRAGDWSSSPIFTHLDRPFRALATKTWGVIGMGTIGREVARVAAAFGCRIVYHSTSGRNLSQPFQHLKLDALLESSDVVSIHAPLNLATQGMIGDRSLQRMKSDSILINVARGGIVDESALARSLERGDIGGAGIDVTDPEPPDVSNPLVNLDSDRCIMTPHIGGLSRDARQDLVAEVAANIRAFFRDQLRNRVQ